MNNCVVVFYDRTHKPTSSAMKMSQSKEWWFVYSIKLVLYN